MRSGESSIGTIHKISDNPYEAKMPLTLKAPQTKRFNHTFFALAIQARGSKA
jgi:hypothetical protein